jgi:DNA-binding GntR family transcriptional regulator
MSMPRAVRAPAPAAAEKAIGTLEALLETQRRAMIAGDVPALGDASARIHALLSDPAWRRDAARSRDPLRVRTALKTAAVNAGLAARGEAHAARALSALDAAPSLYTASGALGAQGGRPRGVSA